MAPLFAAVVVACLSAGVSAQRASDGRADLEGTWNGGTATPLQRPPELAGKPSYTEQEAEEWGEPGLRGCSRHSRRWIGRRARIPFKASRDRIFEHTCHEGNYAVENAMRGARAEDTRKKPQVDTATANS